MTIRLHRPPRIGADGVKTWTHTVDKTNRIEVCESPVSYAREHHVAHHWLVLHYVGDDIRSRFFGTSKAHARSIARDIEVSITARTLSTAHPTREKETTS